MLNRVDKLLIGKDIGRTANLTGFPSAEANNLADGEAIVLDKDLNILAPGSTIADTDTIFIAEGIADTYSHTNEAGTLVSGVRRFILSDPIEGALVRSYQGASYTAKAEGISTLIFTTAVTVGREYVLRIVYKDIKEHPGQFTQTYRYIPTVTTLATFVTALKAKVNAHKGRRVVATETGNTTVILTGLPMPECTTGLTDIDEFSMVEFDVFMNYVDTNGNWQTVPAVEMTSNTPTAPVRPIGSWEVIRDIEKASSAYRGVTNKIVFPVITPAFRTVKAETYDMVIIESDKSYLSPDNAYVKRAPLTTALAVADNASGPLSNQMGDILSVLNPWMASCPGAFANVSV